MREFLLYTLRPDFVQAMPLMALAFLLPLKHRKHWKTRLAGWMVLCFLYGGFIFQQYHYSYGTPWQFFCGYITPLLLGYCTFVIACDISFRDALYGTACAYAAQHAHFCVTIILWGEHYTIQHISGGYILGYVREWAVFLAVWAVCYLLFVRKLPVQGAYKADWRKAISTAIIVLAIAMVLNRMVRTIFDSAGLSDTAYVICMAYDLFNCLFLLWLQTEQRRELALAAALEGERRLRRQMEEQYELSRENISIINQKCHDLKHQVSALRLVKTSDEREAGLRELEGAVLIYDAIAKTGNEVLDTVLTEKSLLCEKNGISWTCMADGGLLDFMQPVDLYTLFGNALDNAIESSQAVDETEQRTVAVEVRNRHGAAFIQIENYYAQPVRLQDGLPLTTKPDAENHGYGLKSIRSITERYGGVMDIAAEDNIFRLNILIPIPA
ncbi:MAG: ATP-binding protein [Clostridiales bacterium]|nr:ATP-binding protein [Clostridiales bacterium]